MHRILAKLKCLTIGRSFCQAAIITDLGQTHNIWLESLNSYGERFVDVLGIVVLGRNENILILSDRKSHPAKIPYQTVSLLLKWSN